MTEERLRVLLLDDEDSLRVPLKKFLEDNFGYHVAAVASAEETLWLMEETRGRYDVALIDEVLLDGLDGIQVMERIKGRYPDIECIVFTGWGTASRQRALQAGAFRYLEKPFDNDELAMLIRTAAQQVRLRSIGRAILSERDLDRVLESIAGAARSLALADEAAIVLLDRATGRLRVHTKKTYPAEQRWWRHFEDQDLSKEIIQTGQVVRVPDTTQDVQVEQNVVDAGICAFLGVPIPGEGSNLGVLYVYSRKPGRFDAWETVAVLQTLAGQAGLAIANARAFQQIHAHAGYMEALVQAGQGLTKTTRLEDQLAMAWDFVREQLSVSTFFVALYDKQTDLLCFPLAYDEDQPIEIHDRSLGDDPKQWGITGYVIKSGQELYWPTDEKKQQQCGALGIESVQIGKPCQSCFYLPLKIGDETIGVTSVQSYDCHAFSPILLDVCRALGSQLSVALENAQLFDTTRCASEQLSALNEVVLEIGKELSQDALLRRIIEQAMTLMSAEGGRVYLLDATGEHFTLATTAGLSLDLEGQRIGKNEGLTGEILRTRKPQKVADYYCWEKRLRILDAYKLTGVAGAPIRVGDRVLGTLVVHDTRPGKQFDDTMLTLLQQFANHAGLALLKAELLERLQAIQQVSATVTSSLESQEVLNRICQAAVGLFGVDHSGLVLFDKSLKWGTVEGEYPAHPNTLGTKIPIEGVLAEERLAFNGETLVFSDVEEAVSELGPVLDIWRRLDIRSILVIPIIYQNRSLGSFSLDAVGHVRQFTSEEVELCKVFAAHVAVAVENARLFSELVEAKEWREALIEYAFDAVIAIDQDAKITVFNQRAEEMFGWTAEEMIGNTVARLHTDVGKAREIFNVVNREGAITDWDVELKHRDGTRIPALLSAMLIRDSQGNPIGQAGFIRDLRQVNLLEERLRALMRVSQTITGTLELDTVLDLIVESAVAAFPAAQSGVIHLYDERADILRVRAITRDYSAEALRALSLRVGEGIAGWVFQNQQPLVVNDTRQEPRYKWIDHLEVQAHRSMICVPLRVRGRVIGTLSLNNGDIIDAFQPEDLGLLASFGDQAAIAIDNARRMLELEQMRQAAEAMACTIEPRQALQQIVEKASQVLQADSSAIWSYDEIRYQFIAEELVAVGIPPDELERFRKEELKPGRTADTVMRQDYMAVTDISQPEYDFLGQPTRDLLNRIGVQSFQGIALQVGDENLGVLYVNYNRPRDFREEDKKRLETFAHHAALTLKEARLLDQVSKAHDAAKVVAEVSVLEDLEQTLDSIVKGTQNVLDCDAVSLYTYDQAADKLGYPPSMIGVWYPERATRLPGVPRDNIVLKMLERDEPYIVDDTSADPLFGNLRFVMDEKIKSWVAMPLKVGDRRVGVLFVNYRSPHRFTGKALANIRLFAHQAAVAIRNAQLYDETIRTANALEALYEAGKAVTSTLALDEILNRIVEQARRFTGQCGKRARFSDLELVEGNRLKCKAAYPPEHLVGHQRTVGDIDLEHDERIGVIGRAAKTGQSQLVGDVTQDLDYIEYDPETRSELAVPIRLGEEVIGVINVEHPDFNAFDEEDQKALEALAAQAAIAIENARLFRETEHRALQLAAASEVARDATAILDVERLLDETVCLISERFGFYHAGVFLLDDKLEYAVLQAASSEGGRRMLERGHKLKVGEVGIVGSVTGTGEARIVLDVGKDAVHFANPDLPDTRSEMALPFAVRGQVIGALDVQSTEVSAFQDEDIITLQIIADHLANAIENARLYAEQQQRAEQLALINQIAAEISSTLDLDKILQTLVNELARVIGVEQCAIAIFDERGEYGDVVAEYLEAGCVSAKGVLIPLRDNPTIEIVRKTRKPLAVKDAQHDPRMERVWDIMKQRRTQSIMIVPIVIGDEVIGTIGLDAVSDPRDFTREEEWLAETIAYHAAIAIQNAQRYGELRRTRGLVGARTALAWMGMASSAWRHAIDKHALTIREQAQLLRKDLQRSLPHEGYAMIDKRLDMIKHLTTQILEKPIIPPLAAEEGVAPVVVNDLIDERARQLWQNEPYKSAKLQLDLRLDKAATVRASPEWLRRAFDILVDNAVDALADCDVREITVGTREAGGGIEIIVSDTGLGIPEEVQSKLGLEPIEKPEDAEGLGMGLLMAQTIVQTYRGEIRVDSTDPSGTTVVIWLPREK